MVSQRGGGGGGVGEGGEEIKNTAFIKITSMGIKKMFFKEISAVFQFAFNSFLNERREQ